MDLYLDLFLEITAPINAIDLGEAQKLIFKGEHILLQRAPLFDVQKVDIFIINGNVDDRFFACLKNPYAGIIDDLVRQVDI